MCRGATPVDSKPQNRPCCDGIDESSSEKDILRGQYAADGPYWYQMTWVTISDNARSIQLGANRREDYLPAMRVAVVA